MSMHILKLSAAGFFAGLTLASAGARADALNLKGVDLAPMEGGVESQGADIRKLCGTKPLRVALSDGFGGNSWRKIAHREFIDEAAKCPNITEVRYMDAQGDIQRQISDIESLGAQKYDVIVVFPDGGPELIRAMRSATEDGAAVVPYDTGVDFPGRRGRDYTTIVTTDLADEGHVLATWMAEQLHGHGNIIFLGGTAGNPIDIALLKAARAVWNKYPDLKLLEDGPVVTKWDAALAQKAVSGLISKYPKIDGVFTSYGAQVMGAARAFEVAGRPLPIFTGVDENDQACLWLDKHVSNPQFELAATSAHSWMARVALRKGVAAAEGISDPEPSVIRMALVQDSTSKDPAKALSCDEALPPDAVLTSQLNREQLLQLFKR